MSRYYPTHPSTLKAVTNMQTNTIRIAALMESSGVKFGTSGARGLVEDMTDLVCYSYTSGFLQFLTEDGRIQPGDAIAIAGDLRPSTPKIMKAVAKAISDGGYTPVNCGFVASPTVALYGLKHGIANLMVTGSHIPDDRNGIKFNTAEGEILKQDEAGIHRQILDIPTDLFDDTGTFKNTPILPSADDTAHKEYVQRYLTFYPANALQDMRIGLYGHSGVSRDAMEQILTGLGAKIEKLAYSEVFMPVDTEAIRPEDIKLGEAWGASAKYDALVSFDGDGDRPLIGNEKGQWFRGDVAGVLCARHLKSRCIATPVSSNTVVEKCGWFESVARTQIGSPYVVAAMNNAVADGCTSVVGYEANGGFLIATPIEINGRSLSILPTRDAAIVALAILVTAKQNNLKVSQLTTDLPPRFTYSDRLKNFPTDLSKQRIAALNNDDAINTLLSKHFGKVKNVDTTDGLRMTFESEEVVHFRPSGNAPELRCYNEADSEARAQQMNDLCMTVLNSWR